MVRAGCAATTGAPPPGEFTPAASQSQKHRATSPSYDSFTLRACRRQGRSVCSTQHRRFLTGSRPLFEFGVTHSQETRKHFLTGGFSALFSIACLLKPSLSHSRPSLQRRDQSFSADAPSSDPEWPCHAGSLTVACRSSKLLVSTGPAIRSSARAAINCEGEDRCRNALFSRMCGAAIKSTGFASA
jgi:hypothetical protein